MNDMSTLTPETVDVERAYSLAELDAMPADVLEEVWLACPERPFYEAALKSAVDDTYGHGAVVTDAQRLEVIELCLQYYTGTHPDLADSAPRIPAMRRADGSVNWFKVSDRVRTRVEAGEPLVSEPEEKPRSLPRTRILIGVGALVVTLLCGGVLLLRSVAGNRETVAEATPTADVELGTPTPTPLALENIDRPIREGDDLRDYFPVLLEVQPAEAEPRVFPVQQKTVEVAEWAYEPDPDVASAVLGLVVRPVLGIPYTPANEALLESLGAGDGIELRMSTGSTLTFEVTANQQTDRQDVSLFDQSEPGIVLVLLAAPSAQRRVIYGRYPAEQELETVLSDPVAALEVGQSFAVDGASLTVLASRSVSQGAGWGLLLVDLRIEAVQPFNTGSLLLEVSSPTGERYPLGAADPSLLTLPAFTPTTLAEGKTYEATAAFLTPEALGAPMLHVQAGDGDLQRVSLPNANPTASASLDIQIVEAWLEAEALWVDVRLFNPEGQPARLLSEEIAATFTPADPQDSDPVGPLTPAQLEDPLTFPLIVPAGEALDVRLRFDWNGDPYAGLRLGRARFVLELDS